MGDTRKSLLLRAQTGEENAWKDLTDLYRPLIIGWLRRQGVAGRDVDDLSQEILLSVVKYLPTFEHSGRPGAFRSWLRTIVCSRTIDYWRAIEAGRQASGASDAAAALQQFEPATLQAFRRLTLDGVSGAEAAEELGLTVPAVYMAKSRVLKRIRQEAEGL